MKKVGEKSKKGGVRAGAGRPPGIHKTKLSISVDSAKLASAKEKWGGKISQLMEKLLRDYVNSA